MKKDNIEYSFEMENFFGDTLTFTALNDATIIIEYFDFDLNEWKTKVFYSYDKAYNFAYKNGYRE